MLFRLRGREIPNFFFHMIPTQGSFKFSEGCWILEIQISTSRIVYWQKTEANSSFSRAYVAWNICLEHMFNARGKRTPTCRGSQVDEIFKYRAKRQLKVKSEHEKTVCVHLVHVLRRLNFPELWGQTLASNIWGNVCKTRLPNLLLPLRLGHGTYSLVALNDWKFVNLIQKVKIWKNKLSFIRNSLGENSGRCMFFWWCVKFWGQRPSARVWNVIIFQIHSQSWQFVHLHQTSGGRLTVNGMRFDTFAAAFWPPHQRCLAQRNSA